MVDLISVKDANQIANKRYDPPDHVIEYLNNMIIEAASVGRFSTVVSLEGQYMDYLRYRGYNPIYDPLVVTTGKVAAVRIDW